MHTRTGTIVLTALCVGLTTALVVTERRASREKTEDEASIGSYSNKWVETSASLDQQRQLNTSLEGDLKKEHESFSELTNAYARLSSNLAQTAADLKSAQDSLSQRAAKISELESQNQTLDQHALDLSSAITNLNTQIDETRRKLAASEGDKAFLTAELQRLMSQKSELQNQFNDLTVLRAQIAKLKEEMDVSRRLQWIRDGIYARAGQRGAQQLSLRTTNHIPPPNYDLNVEVSADGTIKVIGPASGVVAAPDTNAAAP